MFFYLFLAVLGLWVFVAACGLSLVAASGVGLVAPQHVGSSWARAWNQCPLHWQVDSQPLRHQESPTVVVLKSLSANPIIRVIYESVSIN